MYHYPENEAALVYVHNVGWVYRHGLRASVRCFRFVSQQSVVCPAVHTSSNMDENFCLSSRDFKTPSSALGPPQPPVR